MSGRFKPKRIVYRGDYTEPCRWCGEDAFYKRHGSGELRGTSAYIKARNLRDYWWSTPHFCERMRVMRDQIESDPVMRSLNA